MAAARVNIALVNEMAVIADRMGIDIWEVVEAATTKLSGIVNQRMPLFCVEKIGRALNDQAKPAARRSDGGPERQRA